jgi:hypothetical protein
VQVLRENVTLINALAFAVMEEKVLLEERIHELADKYGKFEKRRPTIFRVSHSVQLRLYLARFGFSFPSFSFLLSPCITEAVRPGALCRCTC